MSIIVTEINDLENITDEYIIYNHNLIKNKIEDALNNVKEYIINNKLLIVGGMAIDLALKLKGSNLYNELYQIPDFDIISPKNIEHANNIGQILCNNNFENISIIPAIHHTTVRVQLLGYTVFDSTYVPEYIYNKIPSIEYKEFKFVDPNFQKLNQYLSLSFLFKITGPSYNILYRFKKDIERFNLIDNYYKLTNELNINEAKYNKYNNVFKFNINNIKFTDIRILNKNNINNYKIASNNKDIFNKINKESVSYNINSNIILHGILAYQLIYKEFNNLYSKLIKIINIKENDLKIINDYYKFVIIKDEYIINKDTNILSFNYNNELELIFINNDNTIDKIYENLKNYYKLDKLKKYNNILDLKPSYGEFIIDGEHNIKIYDLYGDLLSINLIYIHEIDKLIPISSFTYNLMYFLTNYYLEEDNNKKNIYLYYYLSLKYIIQIITFIKNNYSEEFNKTYNFNNSCFNYSINTLGKENYPDNYYYYIENFKNLVYNNQNLDILPSKNYIGFPNCDLKNIFDEKKSQYYNKYQEEVKYTNESHIIKNA